MPPEPRTQPRPAWRGSPPLHLILPGTPMGVRSALVRATGALREMGIEAGDCGTAETVIAEILNNVVEHAYAGDDDGTIELQLDRRPAALHCEVRDRGRSMPGNRLPDASGRRPDPQDLPEGGFGWALIWMLVDDLEYARRGGQNRLRFSIPLSASPETA